MRPQVLRHVNQKRVLSALSAQGTQSRVGLAQRLGLTRSTLSVIVSSLAEQGLVRDVEDIPRSRRAGRPRVGLELVADGAYFAGVEIGNETSTAVVVDLLGAEVMRACAPTPTVSAAEAERTALTLLREVLAETPGSAERLEGVGIAVPGIVDGPETLAWAPKLGWRDQRIGADLARALDVPVHLENDANACAIGASISEPRLVDKDVLFLILDLGVGAGILTGGRLCRGAGGRGGEVGHIRLPDHLVGPAVAPGATVEEMVGIDGLVSTHRAAGAAASTWPLFRAALHAGDADAVAAAAHWRRLVAWLVAMLATTVAPDVVVVGGPLAPLLEVDGGPFVAALRDHGVDGDLEVAISRHGVDAVAMGAASLPRADFFSVPRLAETGPSTALVDTAR